MRRAAAGGPDGQIAELWTRVRGLRTHARAAGLQHDETPIVLVHGLGVSSRYMLPTLRALAFHAPVLAPDLPGYGRSDTPARPLSVRGLANALGEWLDAMQIERATLLGNSMGCQIAVDLAAREPERVCALVLVGPTVDGHARGWVRQGARLALDSALEPPALLGIIALDYAVFGPRRFLATATSALADPIEGKLPFVQAPTLVVRGSRDKIVSQRWAEETAALAPLGRLVVVPGAAHAVNFNAPEPLRAEVLAFLRAL